MGHGKLGTAFCPLVIYISTKVHVRNGRFKQSCVHNHWEEALVGVFKLISTITVLTLLWTV